MNGDYLDSEAARKKKKEKNPTNQQQKNSYSLSQEKLPFLAGRGKNRGSSLIWLGSA